MADRETLRWGVIGCGDVVEHKSGPALHRADRSEIHAVASAGGASAEAYAAAHDVPVTADPDRLPADSDVDVVYVATPPDSHREYAVAAAEAGKPVLLEKPMGLSVADGRAAIEACDRAGVELFVAYYRRFHPQVERMRELLREGAIGEPVRAYVDFAFPTPADSGWRETPAISGGGWFVDSTAHRIDAAVALLGPPESVDGDVLTVEEGKVVEDVVSLTVTFESGALCTVVSDFHAGESVDTFELYGTGGRIRTEALDDGAFDFETGDVSGTLAFEMPAAPHGGLVEHVERVLLDGAANRTSGRDAILTEAILDNGVRRHYADALGGRWDGPHDLATLRSL